jgi:membrane-associated phospholipid phosphatase
MKENNIKITNNNSNQKQIIITDSNHIKNIFEKKGAGEKLSSTKMKVISIIAYFIIVIWLETFYRDFLFKKFIPFQENIQKNEKNKKILEISKFISKFGGELSTLVLFFFLFLFMPLNNTFLLLQAIIYSSYLTNTFKMIYQSDRPNWHSNYLTFSCKYGYGNPSGHSITCTALYLSLSHILEYFYKIKGIQKIIIFTFFIIFSLLIIISRVILAEHSVNQVIYGFSLGLGLYYILIHCIGYHKYSSFEFFRHIRKKKINTIYYIIHIFLLIFTILIYIFIEPKDTSKFEYNIFNGVRCKIKDPYVKYNNDGLFQSLSITSLIGAQLGLNILFIILKSQNYLINASIIVSIFSLNNPNYSYINIASNNKSRKVIEWNKTKDLTHYFLRIPIILISSIGVIFFYIIPGDFPLFFIFLFKSAVPFFLGMLGIHFIGIYICISLKISNKDIYKMDMLHDITASA